VRTVLSFGIVGVGKMGLSHLALFNAHRDVRVAGICEPQPFIASAVSSQTGIPSFKSYEKLIEESALDAVVIATPSATHFDAAMYAIGRGLHVFVEKPLSLSARQSWEMSEAAKRAGVANQVGYHNRFIGTFGEVRRLVQDGAIGDVYHVTGSAFGQVVTKPKTGFTWRSKKSEGGGCLHDYASHVVDLMNWVMGPPKEVLSARLQSVHSKDVEDAVYAQFGYASGASGTLETNWSDEAHRKMSTSITVYGTQGKIHADRQECQVFLKPGHTVPGYDSGWTIRYITELQQPVSFYLRGEEYSAQVDAFVDAAGRRDPQPLNSFTSAYETDWTIDQILKASEA
jgi:scyllo-inositol 2-dehydrogenase (NADP+)